MTVLEKENDRRFSGQDDRSHSNANMHIYGDKLTNFQPPCKQKMAVKCDLFNRHMTRSNPGSSVNSNISEDCEQSRIYNHLLSGCSITSSYSTSVLGVQDLEKHMEELRNQGMIVETTQEDEMDHEWSFQKVTRYRLVPFDSKVL